MNKIMEKIKPTHIIAIIIRLFALILFLKSFEGVLALVLLNDPISATGSYLPYYSISFLGFIFSIILWYFPFLVSNKIYSIEHSETSNKKLSLNELYSLGFILLGVFLLFHAVSDTFYWFIYFLIDNTRSINVEDKANMITTVLQFIMSLFLIFRFQGFISLIRNHRVK